MANWFLQQGEQRLGPMPLESLQNMVANGQVSPSDLVWTDGMASWQTAGSQPWYFSAAPPAAPTGMAFGGYAPSFAPSAPPLEPLPNMTVWSVLVLIFCCLPGGIVGLVQFSKAKKQWAQGDYAGALDTAKSVKTTLIVSAVIGFIFGAIRLGMVMANK
jgi:hypothetical protein